MAADPNLFAQFAQPVRSVADYGADMDKAEGNKLELIAARQGFADDQSARAASIASGGDTNKLLQALQASGNYKAAQALQKTMLDNRKTQADIGLSTSHAANFDAEAAAKTADARYKAFDRHAQNVSMVQTPQDVMAFIDEGINNGLLPPGTDPATARAKLIAQAQSYPTIDAWKQATMQASVPVVEKFKQDAENARNAATNATSVANNTATNLTSVANNTATNRTHLTGVSMTQAGENQRNVATNQTHLLSVGLNADGSPTTDAAETVKAIGEGRQAPPTLSALRNPRIAAIMDQVNKQYPGFDATQYGARAQAAKSFATGKDGQAVESANTALNHLDTLRQLATAQANGDMRLYNEVANKLSTQFGGTAPANLQAAITMVGPEISKAVIGAGGGQGDRDKVDSALAALTKGGPAQATGVLNTMQDLFGGRLTEKARTYERTTGRKDFSENFLSPAAQAVLAARQGAPAAGALPGGLTMDAIDAELAKRPQPKKMASGGPVGYAPQRVAGGPVFWAPQAGAMQAATPADTGMAPPPAMAPAPPAQAPQGFTLGQGYGVDQFGGDFNPPPMPPPVAQPRRAWGRRPNALQSFADGGRVEPKVGTKGPVRSSGSDGGLSDNAIMRLLTSMPPPQPSDAAFVDPTNPRAVLAARMHAAGLYAHGGRVSGPGGPRDDEVPAMLSNGEHVMDAATVTAIGGGDNAAGQRKLNAFRKKMKGG